MITIANGNSKLQSMASNGFHYFATFVLVVMTCNEISEYFDSCGNLCDRTCKNSRHNSVPCIKLCARGACACKEDFVRYNGICIRKEDCPLSSKQRTILVLVDDVKRTKHEF